MKFIKRRCSHCYDYTELYDDRGNCIKAGDYYHDKISEWISGFIDGVKFTTKEEVVLESENIICDNCQFDIDWENKNS